MLMNRAMAIYCGIIATVLLSSIGLVFIPDKQIAALQPNHRRQRRNVPDPPVRRGGPGAQSLYRSGLHLLSQSAGAA